MEQDLYHNAIRVALEKDSWIVTDDPLTLTAGQSYVWVDLAVEKILMAERQGEKILVEMTTFNNPSLIEVSINRLIDNLRAWETNNNNLVPLINKVCIFTGDLNKDVLVQNLQNAFLQYLSYANLLSDLRPDRVLYLAICEEMYTKLFEEAIVRFIFAGSPVKFMIFDADKQEVVQWKNFEIHEDGDRNFHGIDLHQSELYLVFNESDFTEADLSETNIYKTEMNLSNLSQANLNKANLTRVFFCESNLSQVDLTEAHLSEVFLVSADLNRVKMNRILSIQSYFSKADLQNADLTESIFASVDLKEANLEGANLRKAQFISCDLRGANLKNARVDDAVFDDVQLNGATWVDGSIIN
ncbi:element excision factor XisH family protein [Roseofilum sp. Guam]|uniref:element excision factor XisH family protein n=1 Tax=Roseofilum sp. Guam TaxID=2821502 RepID=UPI001B1755D7|nr:element excision factor XisH family protein [Roseofilum sp. Guam]MBP0028761.1 pentapeptide repeat-containing protein [Roseofilum sp. Guam]